MRLLVSVALPAALGASWLAQGCHRPAPERLRPSLLLITTDTARADHFSCLGYPRRTTPRFDALGAEGAVFTAAYTPMPTTAPAHASLLTGTYPRSHGVLKNGWSLAPEHETLAEVLER